MLSRSAPKAPCPDCGLFRIRGSIKRHQGTRPCRAKQIQDRILMEHGLVMIHALTWQKVLQWAGVTFERWPAQESRRYRRPHRRKHVIFKPDFLFDPKQNKKLYEGLGDALFVEPWVELLLRHRDSHSRYKQKEHSGPLVDALQRINEQGEELQLALMTTWALGGDRAVHALLVTEGIWTLQKWWSA